MKRELRFTSQADRQLTSIENNPADKALLKQVQKTLGYLETNLRVKSLQTHEHRSLTRRYGIKVFEAYIQQNTPGAFRVFWHYGPDEANEEGGKVPVITIIAIVSHPDY